ncbi:MAG TPA: hypothetical protein VEF04_21070 [Blastocatellia bacterium]|nr:hypothetical protein [Blastocatellia bacterium]
MAYLTHFYHEAKSAKNSALPSSRFVQRALRQSLALAFILIVAVTAAMGQTATRGEKQSESLSAVEFTRLSTEMSEEGGHFPSDNFTSNETSYLTVIDKLRQLGATGGAYIGVGPEQNFTYIAKVRPRIAFIVDIRRQAIIQHLMYKAIFHLAPTRGEFLSLLLSRPLSATQAGQKEKTKIPVPDASINDLLAFFSSVAADDKAYASNLTAIKKAIREDFKFPLSETDEKTLEYVYDSFRTDGLEIGFRLSGQRNGGFGGFGGGFGRFPSFKELLAQTDLNGKQSGFLASVEDYDFLRSLHRKNLIIPVVGDFAGSKALAAVGDYLRKNNYTVTAFYTSNVEMVLFRSGIFEGFARNVKKLPINDRSLIIRAAFSRYPHPAQLPGYTTYTLLHQIQVFVRDFEAGRFKSYNDLINTNYIAPEKP